MPRRPFPSPRARRSLIALALLGAVAAGLWVHRIEFGEQSLDEGGFHIDAYLYYQPAFAFARDELRSGRLPLWNPYQMAGQPTLALHIPGVLYPPNLLLLAALPTEQALRAHAVLHLMIAGFFAWLFAGRIGLGPIARLVSALVFLLTPNLLLGIYMPPFLSTPVWLPAVLWSIHGLASEARPRFALAVGVTLALSFLGGHAQAFVYVAQVGALYGIFALFFVAAPGTRLRVAGLALAAGVLSFALAAPQLLPALELLRGGVRGTDGLSLEEVARSSVRAPMLPRGWLGWLAPNGVDRDALQPALLLPLIVCGALARRHRAHLFFLLLLAALSGLFLAGADTPVFRIYYELPLGNLFRNPSRSAFTYALCGALLCGIGVDSVVRGLERRRVVGWLPALVGVLLLVAVSADRYSSTRLPGASPAVLPELPPLPEGLAHFAAEQSGHDRFFLEKLHFFDPGIRRKGGSMLRVPIIPDYEPNQPRDYARFLGIDQDPLWHGHVGVAPANRLTSKPTSLERLDLMSARYYAVRAPTPPRIARKLRRMTGDGGRKVDGVQIFEREGALPRIHVVRRARGAEDLEGALALLDADDFDPWREAVVIGASSGEAGPEGGAQDSATLLSLTPQQVVAEVRCEARCLAVLSDLHDPGWVLRVDGQRREILRANGIFRGVWLEAGQHRLVYSYESKSFRAGLGLFAAALLVTVGCAAYSRQRSRRGR